jgi:hypothetical protein
MDDALFSHFGILIKDHTGKDPGPCPDDTVFSHDDTGSDGDAFFKNDIVTEDSPGGHRCCFVKRTIPADHRVRMNALRKRTEGPNSHKTEKFSAGVFTDKLRRRIVQFPECDNASHRASSQLLRGFFCLDKTERRLIGSSGRCKPLQYSSRSRMDDPAPGYRNLLE